MKRTLLISACFAALAAGAGASSVPETPSLKPDRVYTSGVTDPVNAQILNRALRAADSRNWGTVATLQRQTTDPAVRDTIKWLRASEGVPGMDFQEMDEALQSLSTWPRTATMRKRAEAIIADSPLSPAERISWLKASGPQTGAGKVALADALKATGETADAETVIRDAWRNHSLERSLASQVKSRWATTLTSADHIARTEFLLWTNQRSAAARMKPLLGNSYDRLVDARIALAGRGRGVDAKVKAVPADLQDNAGLLYERAKWRRKRGNQSGATPLLTGINGNDIPEAGRDKLWKERRIHMRTDLKDGAWSRAYQLSAPHGMSSGAGFAEAEWKAGWIALRLNDEPERALAHFEAMTAGVSTPISLSRGQYWAGRAHDVLGNEEDALLAYGAAAEHKTTYYGQLAAQRLSDPLIAFEEETEPTDAEIAEFDARPMVKAMRLLGEAGETRLFRRISYHLDDQLSTPAEFVLLARVAAEYQVPDVGVRGAKAGLAKGIVAPSAAYPLPDIQLSREPGVERPLMYALTRQESEMNPGAVSHVGARGLMQFMPATARLEARKRGMPYRKSWLIDDPGYNMTLGGAHLDTLLGQFNGSYIMTAAAYNAGPSRPTRWMRDYGDPRTGDIDPIDWVEFIPFSETRNYVQRILENTQVYRHRVSGQPAEITLNEDLQRGG